MRLGGIVHAARGSWALNRDYIVQYLAPDYLDEELRDYLAAHGCKEIIKIGNVSGAPNVFLIQDVKEFGDQGYEFLLRDRIRLDYFPISSEVKVEDAILISGNYSIDKVIGNFGSEVNLHIDVANNTEDLNYFEKLPRKPTTVFISTSSTIFKKYFKDDFKTFCELFRPHASRLILKENRGGSRGIDFNTNDVTYISSQTQPIAHSVGVGDVFDACYVNYYKTKTFEEAMTIASWVAYEYASTTFPKDFKDGVQRVLKVDIHELLSIKGVSLPWERRKQIHVYMAGPDFDFLDTSFIDLVERSLNYHNFSCHRPIKENGQMEPNASRERKKELFSKDLALLENCQLVIATLLNNDPGTLVEIGLAEGLGIPVIVYDPHNIAKNCMLTELPRLVTDDLDEVICEVFILTTKIK